MFDQSITHNVLQRGVLCPTTALICLATRRSRVLCGWSLVRWRQSHVTGVPRTPALVEGAVIRGVVAYFVSPY